MGTVMLLIGGGLIFSLVVFFICEEKSLKDIKFSDMKCMMKEEVAVFKCFEEFQTIRYIVSYFLALLVFDVLIANFVYLLEAFGLVEILS